MFFCPSRQIFRQGIGGGDPGSGKTTLMKYYAISCLKDEVHKKFGFKEQILPLYFPLRELEPKDAVPDSLPENKVAEAKTEPNQNRNSAGNIALRDLIALGAVFIALATLLFSIYVRRKSVRHAKEIEQAKLEVKEEYEEKLEQQRLGRLKNEERAKREVADERAQIKQKKTSSFPGCYIYFCDGIWKCSNKEKLEIKLM